MALKIYVFICRNACLHFQYGKDCESDSPVKLLDKLLYAMAQSVDEQLVVVSQVFKYQSHWIRYFITAFYLELRSRIYLSFFMKFLIGACG